MTSTLALLLALSVTVDAAPVKHLKVRLREIKLDATRTGAGRWIRCSPKQVDKGLRNLVSFSRTKDNSHRDLVPTYRPLDNQAAWYIDGDGCPSLKPYFNGLGFESYDQATGQGVIYLARFNQLPIDQERWDRAQGDEIGRMQMFFQPDFDVTNLVKFKADCQLTYPSILSRLGWTEPELLCTLDEGKGLLRLTILAR